MHGGRWKSIDCTKMIIHLGGVVLIRIIAVKLWKVVAVMVVLFVLAIPASLFFFQPDRLLQGMGDWSSSRHAFGGLNREENEQAGMGKGENVKEYTIATVAYKTKDPEGREMEMYRWDPGTIVVQEGDDVRLRLYGFMGGPHKFMIEGTDVKGTVYKGKETVVEFKSNREGLYRIICTDHMDAAHHGPMIGYIVVE